LSSSIFRNARFAKINLRRFQANLIGRCGRGGLERRRAAFSHTHGRQPGTADARRRAEPSPHYPPAPTTAGRFGVHHAHAGCHTRRRASRPRSGRSFQPDSPRPPRIGGIRLRKEHADRSRRALRPSHSFVVSTIRSNCSRKCRQSKNSFKFTNISGNICIQIAFQTTRHSRLCGRSQWFVGNKVATRACDICPLGWRSLDANDHYSIWHTDSKNAVGVGRV
ncbi:hypothetical protein T01_15459, partial [Trichinella spiralis]